MAEGRQEFRNGERFAFLAITIGLLLVVGRLLFEGLVLAQPQCALPAHPSVHLVVEKFFVLIDKIGDAAIIAGLIGILIDRGLKTHFIQEVVRSASPKLIGQHLPEPIRKVLLSYFKINFIRPSWEIEYEIAMLEGNPEFVSITSRIWGDVQNCGSDREEFAMVCSLDAAPVKAGLGEALFTRISLTIEPGILAFDENPPDNSKLVQPDRTKLFKRSVSIPADGRFKTVLEAVEYRPICALLPLFAGTTVMRATVRIRYPKKLLDVQVSTGNSTNLEPESNQWGAQWEIPTLLPGQCIVTIWNPIEPLAVGDAADATPSMPATPTKIEPQAIAP